MQERIKSLWSIQATEENDCELPKVIFIPIIKATEITYDDPRYEEGIRNLREDIKWSKYR